MRRNNHSLIICEEPQSPRSGIQFQALNGWYGKM